MGNRQSHLWPQSVDYPQPANPDLSASCTSTMIPVSHLAREGFTPVAMGMVLCADPDIQGFVRFVQGLHAEGVVSLPFSLIQISHIGSRPAQISPFVVRIASTGIRDLFGLINCQLF